jgi:hypothetical protein
LTVELPTIEKAGTTFKLRVDYSTTDKCTAIQFLKPSQTEGKQVNNAGFQKFSTSIFSETAANCSCKTTDHI